VSDTVGVHRGAYSRFGSGRPRQASPVLGRILISPQPSADRPAF
jgi:hypothetical protein